MNENNLISASRTKAKDSHSLLKQAEKLSFNFFHVNHRYSPLFAAQELGIESELVQQLVKEYAAQLLQANISFRQYLSDFKHFQENNQELDFTPLQNLAHKNLGVARNLRIKDCEDVLHGMMNEESLNYLSILVKVLESCAIKLDPIAAFNELT